MTVQPLTARLARNEIVSYRVTPDEERLLLEAAETEGYDQPSTWERDAVVTAAQKNEKPAKRPADKEAEPGIARKFRVNAPELVEIRRAAAACDTDPNPYARRVVLSRARRVCSGKKTKPKRGARA